MSELEEDMNDKPVVIRGIAKSGRVWKTVQKQRNSAIIKGKTLHRSWKNKDALRKEKMRMKDIEQTIREDRIRHMNEKRQAYKEREKRRQENIRKSEIVQVKRERILKASQEITVSSKRVICLLHRCVNENEENGWKIFEQAVEKLKSLANDQFKTVAFVLKDEYCDRYEKYYSSGLQEYIEAWSFLNFLQYKKLITLFEIRQLLQYEFCDDGNVRLRQIHISYFDYVMGIADLAGELMRYAVVSSNSDIVSVNNIYNFMAAVYRCIKLLNLNRKRGFVRKEKEFLDSIMKVENIFYNRMLLAADSHSAVAVE
ncbi:Translin-associated protein X [Trichinella sp. T9]|uniref:Translin-associated protein X n=1 Tax=Trichinella murrelli TaxID=144512 RepID=A0A0V0U7E7_9BILA|nr:Translin-associated protein X [Trichinella murrelli]KRX62640.1 Translin-associated protein X [Trichinella sp. T9]